jgi:hypothetical protein
LEQVAVDDFAMKHVYSMIEKNDFIPTAPYWHSWEMKHVEIEEKGGSEAQHQVCPP